MEFHVNLRNYREAEGLTQLQVAERLGITKAPIATMKAGSVSRMLRKSKRSQRRLEFQQMHCWKPAMTAKRPRRFPSER